MNFFGVNGCRPALLEQGGDQELTTGDVFQPMSCGSLGCITDFFRFQVTWDPEMFDFPSTIWRLTESQGRRVSGQLIESIITRT